MIMKNEKTGMIAIIPIGNEKHWDEYEGL